MARIEAVLACAAAMAAIWTLAGLPLALRAAPRPLAWFIAPAFGWATTSALALPLFALTGMSRTAVLLAVGLAVAGAVIALWRSRTEAPIGAPTPLHLAAFAAAALLALAPMAGVLPKEVAEGMVLAPPIFDHSKIAMVDEMIRSGVPAANAFYGEAGSPGRVAYYYLWHFSAAVVGVLIGVRGWEADAALTWFTAFASLSMMAGIAVSLSGRALAGVLVVAFAATASARSLLGWTIGPETVHALVGWATGFGGWLFQVSWAPQHVASATCVVLACYLVARMATAPSLWLAVSLGLVAAAGFESSVWVGGVVFALAITAIAGTVLWSGPPSGRRAFITHAALAGAIAAALSALLLYDQTVAASARGGGMPVTISAVHVLGSGIPDSIRRMLDLPAYWLVYLPLEFPAFFVGGMIGLVMLQRSVPAILLAPMRAFALLTIVSLVAAWLLVSVVGSNNDLGWRAVLPAVMLLIAFAAGGLAHWIARPSRGLAALALAGLLLGVPEGLLVARDNIAAQPAGHAQAFVRSESMWAAVRRHTTANERVGNNPAFLDTLTAWPVNISWALLGDRRSCYAGWELALAFAPISAERRTAVDTLFARVFAGGAEGGDIAALADRHRCEVIVVTPQDGAWRDDPFANSARYRLVEDRADAWRIYRRTGAAGP